MFANERDNKNYDIFVGGWFSDYNDPLDFLNVMKTGVYDSYGLYSNSEYDSLIDSLTGENDNAKRLEIYQKLEDLLVAQDCGVAPLYYSDKHYYYQSEYSCANTTILCNQQIFQLLVNLKAFCVVVLSGQRIDQAVVLAVAIEAVGIINACLHNVFGNPAESL